MAWRAVLQEQVDHGLSSGVWSSRSVGIFYKNVEYGTAKITLPTFIVLIASLATKDVWLLGPYKMPYRAGATCTLPEEFNWRSRENGLLNLPRYVNEVISRFPPPAPGAADPAQFIHALLCDIVFGWERCIMGVKNDVRAVRSLRDNS